MFETATYCYWYCPFAAVTAPSMLQTFRRHQLTRIEGRPHRLPLPGFRDHRSQITDHRPPLTTLLEPFNLSTFNISTFNFNLSTFNISTLNSRRSFPLEGHAQVVANTGSRHPSPPLRCCKPSAFITLHETKPKARRETSLLRHFDLSALQHFNLWVHPPPPTVHRAPTLPGRFNLSTFNTSTFNSRPCP